jgi:hypothetical protein
MKHLTRKHVFVALTAATLFLSTACFAREDVMDPTLGEGVWGISGVAELKVFNLRSSEPSIKNISDQPVKNITVVVGDYSHNQRVVYATREFDADLLPGETWNADFTPQVVRISVDGHALTRLNQ